MVFGIVIEVHFQNLYLIRTHAGNALSTVGSNTADPKIPIADIALIDVHPWGKDLSTVGRSVKDLESIDIDLFGGLDRISNVDVEIGSSDLEQS